jgi:hypothetical protein
MGRSPVSKRRAPRRRKGVSTSAARAAGEPMWAGENLEFTWSKEILELMWGKEILQGVRHEFRGVIDNLTAILAAIYASRSSPEKIARLVGSAENDLRSLVRLADSMKDALKSPIVPPAVVANENMYEIVRAAIAALGYVARGVELSLGGNQTVECLCEKARVEFLLISILRFILRAPRGRRPREEIQIAIDEDGIFCRISITFNFSIRWESDVDDDRNLNWRIITRLIRNMDGLIDPAEFAQLSRRLNISLRKGSGV